MGYKPKTGLSNNRTKRQYWRFVRFLLKRVDVAQTKVALCLLVFIKYLLQSELNKSYSNVKLIVYSYVFV